MDPDPGPYTMIGNSKWREIQVTNTHSRWMSPDFPELVESDHVGPRWRNRTEGARKLEILRALQQKRKEERPNAKLLKMANYKLGYKPTYKPGETWIPSSWLEDKKVKVSEDKIDRWSWLNKQLSDHDKDTARNPYNDKITDADIQKLRVDFTDW